MSAQSNANGESILFGAARVSFPGWNTYAKEFKMPFMNYRFRWTWPGSFFSMFLNLGLGLSALYLGKRMVCGMRRAYNYFKSFSNGHKYLKSTTTQVVANGQESA